MQIISNDQIIAQSIKASGRTILYDIHKLTNLLAPELLFLILAHPVYKQWIIREPNTLEFWNKLHFEGKKTESIFIH